MTITVRPSQKDIDIAIKNGTRLGFPGSLCLLPHKEGKHCWRVSFEYLGARRQLGVGKYPETSADQATQRAQVIHAQVEAGLDPSAERKKAKKARGEQYAESDASKYEILHPKAFHSVAMAWVDAEERIVSEQYRKVQRGRIFNHLQPTLGHKLLEEVTAKDVYDTCLAILRKRKDTDKKFKYVDTARRVAKMCSSIFDHGMVLGYASKNPCQLIIDKLPKAEKRHFPAITNPMHLAEILPRMNAYHGTPVVRAALRLLPFLMVRPGNLRNALWSEIDLDRGFWIIPAEKMKASQVDKETRDSYIVPLCKQAIQILRELYELTGASGRVFPGQRGNEFISENTINKALAAIGVCTEKDLTGHGFRAVARTMIREQLGVNSDTIELQLDHIVKDANGRAYNRTELVLERQHMMGVWGNYLEDLLLGRIVYVDPLEGFTPITVSSRVSTASKTSSSTYAALMTQPIVVADVCEVSGNQAALVAQLIKSGAIIVQRKPKLYFEEWVEDVLGPNSARATGTESAKNTGYMQ